MLKKIKNAKLKRRIRRKLRIRNKITGTASVPRVTVFRSNKNISVQAIDDSTGKTLCSFSTYGKAASASGSNVASAKSVGEALAAKLVELKVEQVVFDRNGYLYHGKVAAVADAIREKKIRL